MHVLLSYGYWSCDFEVNQTKIKGGYQSGRKVVPHDSKCVFPLGSDDSGSDDMVMVANK